jgi:hypothetical protein
MQIAHDVLHDSYSYIYIYMSYRGQLNGDPSAADPQTYTGAAKQESFTNLTFDSMHRCWILNCFPLDVECV